VPVGGSLADASHQLQSRRAGARRAAGVHSGPRVQRLRRGIAPTGSAAPVRPRPVKPPARAADPRERGCRRRASEEEEGNPASIGTTAHQADVDPHGHGAKRQCARLRFAGERGEVRRDAAGAAARSAATASGDDASGDVRVGQGTSPRGSVPRRSQGRLVGENGAARPGEEGGGPAVGRTEAAALVLRASPDRPGDRRVDGPQGLRPPSPAHRC
jgi:hypothetical protein